LQKSESNVRFRIVYNLGHDIDIGTKFAHLRVAIGLLMLPFRNILQFLKLDSKNWKNVGESAWHYTLLKMTKGKPMLMCAGEHIPPS
jgi:hypothetical protein